METQDNSVSTTGARRGHSGLIALIQALRPRQWAKNLLVFLPFVFAINVAWSPHNPAPVPELWLRAAAVFLAFCALSSGVYLFNDLMDRKSDALHPRKRHRPIASGSLGVLPAVGVMALLVLLGLAVMTYLSLLLGLISLIYLTINLGYSTGIKEIVLLDVIAVASGYVIRAVAGAVAIGVAPSPWLYTATAAGALFIVLGRRYAEVRLAGNDAAAQRSVLADYAGPFIGQLLNIAATAALVSYTLYTVEAENLPDNHTMLLTIPFVVFGLFRYLYLLNTSQDAESPEQLFSRDLPLLVSIIGWTGVSVLVLTLNA
jgi:4-hydroxybenzoate polyprenyltransferase